MLGIILVILHVIVCFLLIAVILLQAGRGQGFAGSSFSGGGVQSLLGTRSADILTKATTIAAILFLFTCIGLDMLEARRSRSLFDVKKPVAPVDVQQIQKILDKIKTEGEKPRETAAVPDLPTAESGAVSTPAAAPEPAAPAPETRKTE